jgi:hypothetical protein
LKIDNRHTLAQPLKFQQDPFQQNGSQAYVMFQQNIKYFSKTTWSKTTLSNTSFSKTSFSKLLTVL